MKRFLSVLFLTLLSHLFLFATQSLGKLDFLRCEYLVTPLGVDVPTPRFSWRLPAHLNKQQAYRYIRRFRRIDFLVQHYEAIRTLDFKEALSYLTLYCQRQGGAIA